jgi:hypothetical protein
MKTRITGRARCEVFLNVGNLALPLLTVLVFAVSCSPKRQAGLNASPSPSSSPANSPVVQLSPDTSSTTMPSPSPARKIFKTGEAVPAGYLGYKVYGSWFSDHLSDQEAKMSPAANYLYVDLSIVNTDKKDRAIGPFKLIDDKGKEYSPSEKARRMEKSVGQIQTLGPSASKRGYLIFEGPKERRYMLEIQGFTASEIIKIELTPASAPPR